MYRDIGTCVIPLFIVNHDINAFHL